MSESSKAVRVGAQWCVDERHARLTRAHAEAKNAVKAAYADVALAEGAAYNAALARHAVAKRHAACLWNFIADTYMSGNNRSKVEPKFEAKWRQENADLIK